MLRLWLTGFLICSASLRLGAQSALNEMALDQLGVTGSALMIAAHPDDENTAMLAWLAQGRHLRTGYLSLTRGEGGQNVIGSEQGHLLGMIRTEELMAARRVDGAEQFFTRAVDFGFSKTADETLTKWDRRAVLGDIVQVIRTFRPDVIILRFSGTPRDGHGQHQASAILGKEAYAAAADPNQYPEQIKSGLQPWRAKRLFWNVFAFTKEQEKEAAAIPDKLEIDTGTWDPVIGRSFNEQAAISRSQHRSQAMGTPLRRGTSKQFLALVSGDPASADLMDGITPGWARVQGLAGVDASLLKAREAFRSREPWLAVASLLEARKPMAASEDPIAKRKRVDLDETIAALLGLWAGVTADRPMAAPGTPVQLAFETVNRSPLPVSLRGIKIEGLNVPTVSSSGPLSNNVPLTAKSEWKAVNAPVIWPPVQPEPNPVLLAHWSIDVSGTTIELVRPVVNRFVDDVRGEVTRPFSTVPPVSLQIAGATHIFADNRERPIAVDVHGYAGQLEGDLTLTADGKGWRIQPSTQHFQIAKEGGMTTVAFRVTPPPETSAATVTASAVVNDFQTKSNIVVLRHGHIPELPLREPAAAKLARADVNILARRIGYITGAGDEVPAALRQLGCSVDIVSPEDLASGDLNRFDAIVTGVRAYNIRDDIRPHQDRLFKYVEDGGTFIVQYVTTEGGPFGGGDQSKLERLGPYPFKISRDRVTVEESPVEILRAGHPLLTIPNKITAADFEGWVQERGLYFASDWDKRYETVLASQDPGEKPLSGGILFARYGKGAYIFTSYSWFRQLPAGVPGAFRLFANLLSAGRAQAQ